MNKANLIFLMSACLIILTLANCKSDGASAVQPGAIEKDWKVVGGERNGKATGTMNGAYFNFKEGNLNTNYLLRDMTRPFTFNADKNTIDIGDEKDALHVQYLSADSMHLTTKIRNIDFDFFLN